MTRGTTLASIVLSLALAACNNGGNAGNDSGSGGNDAGGGSDSGSGGNDAGGGSDSGSGGNDAGGGSDAGPPHDVGPTVLSDAGTFTGCMTYCTSIMTNCTATHQQYGSMDNCMNSCAAFPAGASTDTTGDTLGCRTYHATAAATNPTLHCPHAGPGGAGVCGANCAGYCDIAMRYCVGNNQVYVSRDQCMQICMATPDTAGFNVTDTTLQDRDVVACLLYHVQEGSSVPMDHCLGDLVMQAAPATNGSITCMNP